MPTHWGPGPVFIHESLAATRRWQLYALRSLFVLGPLAGLVLAWVVTCLESDRLPGSLTIRELASLGQYFYLAIASVQLTLVLLVAPAATADAICLDRSRGNLTHMCVTDLSNGEIVLGKLAARLVPVFGMVAATLPVLALAGLLGGVVLEAIVTLTLITLTLAVFGCSLAMAISVRATKTHEVLMAVYGIEAVWVMGPLLWMILQSTRIIPGVPAWFYTINPFVWAWAPDSTPLLALLLCGTLALSAVLVSYAVLRIRAETPHRSGLPVVRRSSRLARTVQRLSAWRPGPSLDDNPVLWREWRRGRPSRLAKVVWGLFIASAVAGTAWGIVAMSDHTDEGLVFLALINGYQATFGLLLVSITAPTVLAEERLRGSLDVLLASPLATERIVLAKWWSAYRVVPALALLPAIGSICIATAIPSCPVGPGRSPLTFAPFTAIDRIACASLPVAILLAQGAVVTSVGLALATWIRRLGRALAASVTSYAFVAFGWIVCLEMGIVTALMTWSGLLDPDNRDAEAFFDMVSLYVCPLGGPIATLEILDCATTEGRAAFYLGVIILLLATLGIALLVLGLTLLTFDRSVGRVPERPRRVPEPTGGIGLGDRVRISLARWTSTRPNAILKPKSWQCPGFEKAHSEP